jgi:hypothetical protein
MRDFVVLEHVNHIFVNYTFCIFKLDNRSIIDRNLARVRGGQADLGRLAGGK